MSHVYSVGQDSSTKQLERIACTNEDKELQRLLENNLDLLPGEQINPEDKLRWLLIKREMPVTNPSSGEIWWSIDFFLVDQFGIPTLVECKRRNDTRSRREVVGQMLEYAANGRHYWSASDMRSHAQNAVGDEASLSSKLRELTGAETDAEVFFASVEQNLHTSKMRLIFFLEDSPLELRSVVEFLNGQLKETEVLIVEARQYRFENTRIVVPSLFGFTEEARVAKRESRAETVRAASVKGEAAFWASIETAIPNNDWVSRIRDFVAKSSETPGCKVVWITSCIFLFPSYLKRGLFGIKRNGYTPRQRSILRPRTNSCYCAGFPAPESVSARTRDGSRRKRTPPRSLHVLMFPPGTIFGFHTTPQGMECQHPSGAQHRARSRDDFRVGTASHSPALRVDHTRRADSMMVPPQQLEVAAQQPDSLGFSISR